MMLKIHELSTIRRQADGTSLVLRLGCYDLLHQGHIESIRFAHAQADTVVIGVASDRRVRRLKGLGRPIRSQNERISSIAAMKDVDWAFLMPESRWAWLYVILLLRPHVFVQGNEHRNRWRAVTLWLLGIRYAIDEGEKLDSSTAILRRQTPEKIIHYRNI